LWLLCLWTTSCCTSSITVDTDMTSFHRNHTLLLLYGVWRKKEKRSSIIIIVLAVTICMFYYYCTNQQQCRHENLAWWPYLFFQSAISILSAFRRTRKIEVSREACVLNYLHEIKSALLLCLSWLIIPPKCIQSKSIRAIRPSSTVYSCLLIIREAMYLLVKNKCERAVHVLRPLSLTTTTSTTGTSAKHQ
jgi:hypothetical protein